MIGQSRGVVRERATTRGHHEAATIGAIQTLALLSPAIVATGVRVGQAIKAAIGRWKDGTL